MRDFIMDAFRANPRRRLTFTECRRSMAGDMSAIQRVFQFLEGWGLINYVPASGAAASVVGKRGGEVRLSEPRTPNPKPSE